MGYRGIASDPERSLDLALQSARLVPSLPLAESTLRDALLATRGLRVLQGGGTRGARRSTDAQFSPDGTLKFLQKATAAEDVLSNLKHLLEELAGTPSAAA